MKKIVACVDKQQERFTKVVAQSNHDGGHIPKELSEYADRPLYILIALWCCRQKQWISRKQISAAFAITERRVSFQMSYIIRKEKIIRCQTRKTKAPGARHLCHEIYIELVFLMPEHREKPPHDAPHFKRRGREKAAQNEMRWLLSRTMTGKS